MFLSKGHWTYGPTFCLLIDTHIRSKGYKSTTFKYFYLKQPNSRKWDHLKMRPVDTMPTLKYWMGLMVRNLQEEEEPETYKYKTLPHQFSKISSFLATLLSNQDICTQHPI